MACVCDSEKMTEDTSHAVRTIVCDSEKSRFNVVCKADLSVPEAARRLFVRECLFPQDLLISCSWQGIVVIKTTPLLKFVLTYLVHV